MTIIRGVRAAPTTPRTLGLQAPGPKPGDQTAKPRADDAVRAILSNDAERPLRGHGSKPRAGAVFKAAPEPNSAGRLLTPQEAADFLRLSLSWLAKSRMAGNGPEFVKLGRSIRYAEGALRGWLQGQTRRSTSEQ